MAIGSLVPVGLAAVATVAVSAVLIQGPLRAIVVGRRGRNDQPKRSGTVDWLGLLDRRGQGLFALDENLLIVDCTSAGASLLENSVGSLRGTPITAYLPDLEFPEEAASQVDDSHQRTMTLASPDGSDRPLVCEVEPVETAETSWLVSVRPAGENAGDEESALVAGPAEGTDGEETDEASRATDEASRATDEPSEATDEPSDAADDWTEYYELLVESGGDPMYVLDDVGRFEFVNGVLADRLDCDRADMIGEPAAKWLTDDSVERSLEIISGLLDDDDRSSVQYDLTVLTDDGETIPSENHVSVVESDGEFRGTLGIHRFMPDRKAYERELERYETIIRSLADPVFALDEDGWVTYANPACEELFGYSLDDEVVHFAQHITNESVKANLNLVREMLSSTGEDIDRGTTKITALTGNGRRLPMECSIALLPLEDGEFRGTAGVARDISDQKRRQEVLAVMNRALRHNLRTHVTTITGYAEMLTEAVDDQHAEYVDNVIESASWLNTLGETLRDLQDALDQNREGYGATDITDLVENTARSYRRRHPEATIRTTLPPSQRVDAGPALAHALERLLENAIVHNDSDDQTVDLSVIEATTSGWVDLLVADNGPGIPEAEMELVSGNQEITQLNHASGLGLWVTRWIVEAFEGELRFEEITDEGSTVVIRLPTAV